MYNDILALNSKAMITLDDVCLYATTAVFVIASLRYMINSFQIERLAQSRPRRILTFPARTASDPLR